MRRVTKAEWEAEAIRLYGEDPLKWEFRCPVCGHVATIQDWKDAGATSASAAFSCVGRYIDGSRDAFTRPKDSGGPCNYAGGGLFKLNPVIVEREDGSKTAVFEFAANPKQDEEAKG